MPVVTLLVAGLHGLLLMVLLLPIVALRRGRKVGLGDGGDPQLLQRIRVHANFIENVPFALLLLALLELGRLDRWWVAVLGGVLLLARVLHAAGLSRSAGYSFGRFWGTFLTWSVIVSSSLLAVVRSAMMLSMH
ncbi:MAPEG family protein [Lysobacter sp. HA18]